MTREDLRAYYRALRVGGMWQGERVPIADTEQVERLVRESKKRP